MFQDSAKRKVQKQMGKEEIRCINSTSLARKSGRQSYALVDWVEEEALHSDEFTKKKQLHENLVLVGKPPTQLQFQRS